MTYASDVTIALSLAASLLLATWVLYPFYLWGRTRVARSGSSAEPVGSLIPAGVSVVVATRDQIDVIAQRIDDISRDPPPGVVLEVIVAVDHAAPIAFDRYHDALSDRAVVIRGAAPGGKATALNAGVNAATHEVVILADSRQRFESGSISRLVDALHRRGVGAVSGVVRQNSGDRIMDWYWSYETLIRRGQSASHSLVSTSGQITAIRKASWVPMPAGLICDDLFLTLHQVMRGKRVTLAEDAVAVDTRTFSRHQHFQRKVRTLTGLFQFIRWTPEVLVPWKNPIWLHFVFHKLMRFVTPFLLLVMIVGVGSNLLASHPTIVSLTMLGILSGLALLALWNRESAGRIASGVWWALRLQLVPVYALVNGIRGNWDVWPSHSSVEEVQAPNE